MTFTPTNLNANELQDFNAGTPRVFRMRVDIRNEDEVENVLTGTRRLRAGLRSRAGARGKVSRASSRPASYMSWQGRV